MSSNDSSGVFLGLNESKNGGVLHFMNHYGKKVGTIGTNNDKDGHITVNDRYGNTGWEQSGKIKNKQHRKSE